MWGIKDQNQENPIKISSGQRTTLYKYPDLPNVESVEEIENNWDELK